VLKPPPIPLLQQQQKIRIMMINQIQKPPKPTPPKLPSMPLNPPFVVSGALYAKGGKAGYNPVAVSEY
jgi:hypothetical protein